MFGLTTLLLPLTLPKSAFGATDLRCEYLRTPLNIETSHPRLSWVDEASTRNWHQKSFQILVATNLEALSAGKPDLWDSGPTISNETTQIEYAGKPLSSRSTAFWKVRIWDASGKVSAWSQPARWEMGLLTTADWRGSKWIGFRTPEGANRAPYLRKSFTVSGKIRRARIYACGLGYAEIHANGFAVAPGTERDPAYTDFDHRALYVAYDVTKLIKPGKNAIGAVLGTGWYDVHDKATWNFDQAPWRGRPRLKLVLALDLANGKQQFVVSDPTWDGMTGPIIRDGIYTGEVYDARNEENGWDKADFDSRDWAKPSEMPAPKGKLTARVCPAVTIAESIPAKSISEPKPGVYVVDFGQTFSGHVKLHVSAPRDTQITLRYSERVAPDGMIVRDQIEQFMAKATPPQSFQSDTYICKGGGPETWEQRFSYNGFRYAEVTGLSSKPSLSTFEGRFAHTDLESAADFGCSNDLINKIQRATRYSYLSNAQSIPTDCPQREKNGWTGDAQLAAEMGLMNYRSASFYTKWLDDLADVQTEKGLMGIIVPTGGWGTGARHPAWDSAYPIVANDLYLYANDRRVLATHYDKLKLYVDSLAGELKDDVLSFDSLGDWVPWKTETSSQYTSTVYLYADARILEKAANTLGHSQDAAKFAQLAERVKTGLNRHFYANKLYAGGTQTASAMALYFDLVPRERRQETFNQLVKNVTDQGHIDTGILGAKYVIRVLTEGGRADLAFKLITRTEQPGWGWWFTQGATTLWEDWKGESSLNHIMFGDVSNWFIQWIAGIGLDTTHPGFSHIKIQPQPVGDLTWAKASYQSAHGLIVSSWRKGKDGFHLDVTIPANATATVTLPTPGKVTESGRAMDKVSGVIRYRSADGKTVIEIGSGSYSFGGNGIVSYPGLIQN